MRTFPNNLSMLILAFLLGFTPIQSIAASVSACMSMNHAMSKMNRMSHMYQQMKVSEKNSQHDMTQANQQHDCCDQNACQMSHCASVYTAIIPSFEVNGVKYSVTDIRLKPVTSTIQFYPTSLYRPPKV